MSRLRVTWHLCVWREGEIGISFMTVGAQACRCGQDTRTRVAWKTKASCPSDASFHGCHSLGSLLEAGACLAFLRSRTAGMMGEGLRGQAKAKVMRIQQVRWKERGLISSRNCCLSSVE